MWQKFKNRPGTCYQAAAEQGHEVYLLTLTKGGATRQRHKFNLSIEEMGEVRAKELQSAADHAAAEL